MGFENEIFRARFVCEPFLFSEGKGSWFLWNAHLDPSFAVLKGDYEKVVRKRDNQALFRLNYVKKNHAIKCGCQRQPLRDKDDTVMPLGGCLQVFKKTWGLLNSAAEGKRSIF